MGAFFLIRRGTDGPSVSDARQERMKALFAEAGYAPPVEIAAAGADLAIYAKRIDPTTRPALYRAADGGFTAVTGTMLYRGRSGPVAAEALHRDLAAGAVDHLAQYGHFCAITTAAGGLKLFTDRLGIYPVWRDTEGTVFSSAFLAVLTTVEKPTVNAQCVYEYVFQGATYGGETVVNEVLRLDGTEAFALDGSMRRSPNGPLPGPREPEGAFDACLARNVSNLRRYFDAIGGCFGDGVDTALSGGYDSRLILALMRERGLTPRLHVYGRESDPDVIVAKRIAAGEGLTLEHVDKSDAQRLAPDAMAETVARNFAAFDGTPPDGIFDDGTDLASRTGRCAEGELMLNGGGGEVFRNFFYLPDRSYPVRNFLWSFYSGFDPALCTDAFNEAAYHRALGAKALRAAGSGDGVLSRAAIEFLYVGLRCRYWMGRNNGLNNALGHALTPFIDPNVVGDANATPLRFKNFGRLEAAMIRAIDPKLAGYTSAYGHAFDVPPPAGSVFKSLFTLMRPTWLRHYTWRLHRRSRDGFPYYLGDGYLRQVVDTAFPLMSGFFRVGRVNDAGHYARLCTLEYLFQRSGAVLPEDPAC